MAEESKPQPERRLIPFKSTVSVGQIDRLIDKGLAKLRPHYDTSPVGDEFTSFVYDLWSIFPSSVRYDVIYASVMNSVGKQMDREALRTLLWRLAGNLHKLKEGTPVSPWTRQTDLEWVPVMLVRGTPGKGWNNKSGFFFEYRVLAGQPAGLQFVVFWSLAYIRFIARSMGFKRGKKANYRLQDGSELTHMRVHFLLDPDLSRDEKPGFYHFHVSSACLLHNQSILKRRQRLIPCPLEYTLEELACFQCHMGYDQCPAGCHPKTYTVKGCPRCGEEAWFDPLGKGVICVGCTEKERFHR